MKKHLMSWFSIAVLAIGGVTFISGQTVRPPVPRASQKSMVMQTIGTTEVSITYSRPAVKGRTIFAEAPPAMAQRVKGEATLDNQNERKPGEPIVPFDHLWRAGANEATLFVVSDDVLINGQPLAAGRYSLHMLPTKGGDWTVVFNKDDGQWGSFTYDAAKDALRVKTKAEAVADSKEFLTYGFDAITEKSATAYLRWEKTRVPFTVEVKDVVGSTMTRLRAYVADAKPDEWQRPFNAANYAKANKLTDDAAKWFDMALKAVDMQIAAKPTFANYRAKSNILFNAGRMPEALAVTEKAVEIGKAEKADTSALEKRIADIKAAKP